ncbi:hypothetical protein TNIN_91891 [Trichonephila inaurata madagascariensis]|uniref:Uncharacterized protein n=1 Tax=Trichonephila inaurata madagascariensis TaxID=2747483 RepID=A0A8X6WWQ7_9ARAC|nr:hypothetical protein TNIN_91891 [Trichonephila inaurata madagascariensis]
MLDGLPRNSSVLQTPHWTPHSLAGKLDTRKYRLFTPSARSSDIRFPSSTLELALWCFNPHTRQARTGVEDAWDIQTHTQLYGTTKKAVYSLSNNNLSSHFGALTCTIRLTVEDVRGTFRHTPQSLYGTKKGCASPVRERPLKR